jgi:hypothetical protein
MTKVLQGEARGPFQAGWNTITLPASGLSNGLYYLIVTGRLDSGESGSLASPVKLYRLD